MVEVLDCIAYVSFVAFAVDVGVNATVSVGSNPLGVGCSSWNWCICAEVKDEVADVSHVDYTVLYVNARARGKTWAGYVIPTVVVLVDAWHVESRVQCVKVPSFDPVLAPSSSLRDGEREAWNIIIVYLLQLVV